MSSQTLSTPEVSVEPEATARAGYQKTLHTLEVEFSGERFKGIHPKTQEVPNTLVFSPALPRGVKISAVASLQEFRLNFVGKQRKLRTIQATARASVDSVHRTGNKTTVKFKTHYTSLLRSDDGSEDHEVEWFSAGKVLVSIIATTPRVVE